MKGYFTNNYKFVEIFNIFGACSSQTPPYTSSPAVVAKVSNFSMLKTNDATCVVHNLSNKTGNELVIASCHQRESAAVTHTGSTSWSWALRSSHYTELFSIPWKLSLALDRKRFMFQESRSLNTYLVLSASLPMPPSSPAVLLVIAVLNKEILAEYNDMGTGLVCVSPGVPI